MKITICTILLFITAISFPTLEGETLSGNSVTLPLKNADKLTIVALAYSTKAEGSLKSWFTPMYDKFILKRGIFDKDYDLNLYLVPMFTGLKKSAYSKTLNNLKKSNRKELFDHILFYKGELEPYKSALKLTEKDKPYLFLLDQKGNIVHQLEGKFTESKMESLEDAISLHTD